MLFAATQSHDGPPGGPWYMYDLKGRAEGFFVQWADGGGGGGGWGPDGGANGGGGGAAKQSQPVSSLE